MNTQLVNYGLAEEQSDIRAHVSVAGKCVYVYPTQCGLRAIETGFYPRRDAKTGEIVTAVGYLVPPAAIRQCRLVGVPDHIMAQAEFSETDTPTDKGAKAVRIVCWLLRSGLFPLWTEPGMVEDADLQINGVDITVHLKTRIQVKCDWRCGDGDGCTGNLFLQVAECNPFNWH